MLPKTRLLLAAVLAIAYVAGASRAADLTTTLKPGTPDLKSVGPVAFAPDGVLLVGDPTGAAIFAFDTGDRPTSASTEPIKVEGIDQKIAGMLGVTAQQILINDMAANPLSGNVFLSVSRGRGPEAQPAIIRVNRGGKIEEFKYANAKFAKAAISNPSVQARQDAITDLAYVDGRVFVAGLSNEEFASRLRSIPFPFTDADKGTSVEIFHGSHGRFETKSPIRTFTTYKIDGKDYLLAAYTCTPLVKIPVSDLKPGAHVKGTTIAELGNRNKPLDMIVYQKNGKDYILMANNSRGVMKITTEGIGEIEGITKPVSDKAGLKYETMEALKGVQHLDRLDKEHAVLLIRKDGESLNLDTIALP
jgi:hypothetical protein